jgi:uncharacterized protein YndB with AHSA1/START domain
MDHEPIVEAYELRCSPDTAFAVYAGRIGEWWHPNYTANPDTLQVVTIEPGVGGRVYESHRGGDEIDWGRVTVWEPGRRLVYTTNLAQPAGRSSEITVRFEAATAGTRMTFAHGGWNERNAADRAKFREWRVILDRYAALANDAQSRPAPAP